MICRSCQAEVDNDLVFCTECGHRLFETTIENATVLQNPSVVTEIIRPKQKSKFKTIILMIGTLSVITFLAAGFFLFFKPFTKKNTIETKTTNISPTPVQKPTLQNKPVNNLPSPNNNILANSASNSINNNTAQNSSNIEMSYLNEQVTVEPNDHVTYPLKITEDSVKITGPVKLLKGDQCYLTVYFKDGFNEEALDQIGKVFRFEVKKGQSYLIEQYLIKGEYFLVFENKDGNGCTISAKISILPQ